MVKSFTATENKNQWANGIERLLLICLLMLHVSQYHKWRSGDTIKKYVFRKCILRDFWQYLRPLGPPNTGIDPQRSIKRCKACSALLPLGGL